MNEQKPEPLSVEEIAHAKYAHCGRCIDHEHMIGGCGCYCHPWTDRLLATIDARDADLATARRTMDEMQARIEVLAKNHAIACLSVSEENFRLAEQLKAKEAELRDWKDSAGAEASERRRAHAEIKRKDAALRATAPALELLIVAVVDDGDDSRRARERGRTALVQIEAALKPAPETETVQAHQHPDQPLTVDRGGILRFKANAIVRAVYDHAAERGLSLNEIARMNFSIEDHEQFMQLIGYSWSGYQELSYVQDATIERLAPSANTLRKSQLLLKEEK